VTPKVLIAGTVIALQSTALWAGFETPMRCAGPLMFYNEDGSFETYAMELDLGPDSYEIRSMSLSDRAVITDKGTCGDYLSVRGCRHMIEDASGEAPEFYDFWIAPEAEGGYGYRELWWDGFSGETVLQCVPLKDAAN
jgi:hypothetical protein